MTGISGFRTIGDDCVISISLGATWDGSVNPYPAFGGATAGGTVEPVTGYCKTFGHTEEIKTLDVHGLGDGRERNRFRAAAGEMIIDTFVPSTGYVLPSSKLGCYISVVYNPLNTGTAIETYNGVVTKWALSVDSEGAQMVNITINLDPDFTAEAG